MLTSTTTSVVLHCLPWIVLFWAVVLIASFFNEALLLCVSCRVETHTLDSTWLLSKKNDFNQINGHKSDFFFADSDLLKMT